MIEGEFIALIDGDHLASPNQWPVLQRTDNGRVVRFGGCVERRAAKRAAILLVIVVHEVDLFGQPEMEQTIYEVTGGRQAFVKLAHAWHTRCLEDPIVSHAFSHGYHPQHTERLAAYWAEALGGPNEYTESLGSESQVLRMHSGNGEHREMDEQAQTCFAKALDDAGISDEPQLRATLKAYFRWATERMSAYPESADLVPSELSMAYWSWNGPV